MVLHRASGSFSKVQSLLWGTVISIVRFFAVDDGYHTDDRGYIHETTRYYS